MSSSKKVVVKAGLDRAYSQGKISTFQYELGCRKLEGLTKQYSAKKFSKVIKFKVKRRIKKRKASVSSTKSIQAKLYPDNATIMQQPVKVIRRKSVAYSDIKQDRKPKPKVIRNHIDYHVCGGSTFWQK